MAEAMPTVIVVDDDDAIRESIGGLLRSVGLQAKLLAQLSAIVRKPSPGNAAAAPNPHRRPTAHRLPAGSVIGGFRTPAL